MSGASMEATLELWASSLREVKGRIRPLFTQARVAQSAGLFLDGLLGTERRKTGWMRAEAAGDPGPWRQQAILGRGRWEADALRDVVRDYALETLADPDAVLVIDGDRLPQAGQVVVRGGAAIHGLGRQGHQLPGPAEGWLDRGRRVRGLCVPARPCLHRPRPVSAQGMDGQPSALGGGAGARGGRVCHQAAPGRGHDRARTLAAAAPGPAACWSGAAWPTASLQSAPPGAPWGQAQTSWSRSRAAAGPSRTASRPPRPSLGWTMMRPDPGTAGTGTSAWSCSPSP